MPRSRKRPGNHQYRKPADIPAAQRTKGRITWAVLLGVFALLIGWLANGGYVVMAVAALVGATIGYVIGRSMEKEAVHK